MQKSLKEIYIIGAGDFGREIADTILEINSIDTTYAIAGFIDDDKELSGSIVNDIEVIGDEGFLKDLCIKSDEKPYAIIAIADPVIKERIVKSLDDIVQWENIIHPLAVIKNSAKIGHGNVIQHFSSINSNACIGDHCLINSNTVIGHDVKLGDYSSLMHQVGIMGDCIVGEKSFLGAGAKTLPRITIGNGAVIGAGAIVTKNVEAGKTMAGNPAREI